MGKGVAGGLQRLMHFFLPKEEEFFGLFADMARKAHQAALLLRSACYGEAAAADLMAPVAEVEHAADLLRHDCVKRLNDTFVTPIMFDRQDILDLADSLDDVVDLTRAAIDRMALYGPASIPEAARKLADLLVQCTESMAEGCCGLGALRSADAGFIAHINDLENQADAVLKQGLADLFHHEPNPVEVIKWKEIYDYLEEAIDHCEETAHVIENSLVKNS